MHPVTSALIDRAVDAIRAFAQFDSEGDGTADVSATIEALRTSNGANLSSELTYVVRKLQACSLTPGFIDVYTENKQVRVWERCACVGGEVCVCGRGVRVWERCVGERCVCGRGVRVWERCVGGEVRVWERCACGGDKVRVWERRVWERCGVWERCVWERCACVGEVCVWGGEVCGRVRCVCV